MPTIVDDQLTASIQEIESLSANIGDEVLSAAFAEETPISIVVSESEDLEGGMHALGVERYYNGAIGLTANAGAGGISALRVVKVFSGIASIASSDNPDDADVLSGLALTAAEEGLSLDIIFSGVLEDTSFNFSLGPVWCGRNGLLTQTPPPDTDFAQIVAIAISPTRIIVNFNQALLA